MDTTNTKDLKSELQKVKKIFIFDVSKDTVMAIAGLCMIVSSIISISDRTVKRNVISKLVIDQ
jgi:hypothetical protein